MYLLERERGWSLARKAGLCLVNIRGEIMGEGRRLHVSASIQFLFMVCGNPTSEKIVSWVQRG